MKESAMTDSLEVQWYTQIISFSGSETENVLTRRSPGATASLGRVSWLEMLDGIQTDGLSVLSSVGFGKQRLLKCPCTGGVVGREWGRRPWLVGDWSAPRRGPASTSRRLSVVRAMPAALVWLAPSTSSWWPLPVSVYPPHVFGVWTLYPPVVSLVRLHLFATAMETR